jgi:hypothetical protein
MALSAWRVDMTALVQGVWKATTKVLDPLSQARWRVQDRLERKVEACLPEAFDVNVNYYELGMPEFWGGRWLEWR